MRNHTSSAKAYACGSNNPPRSTLSL